MSCIYSDIISKLDEGQKLFLGTLLKTLGSTPQIPGASAIFNVEGLVAGTMGGGLIENEAYNLAREMLATSTSVLKNITLNAGIDDKEGAICGGSARFLLDAFPEKHLAVFRQLQNSLEKRESGVLLTAIEVEENQEVCIDRHWIGNQSELPFDLTEKYSLRWEEIQQIQNSGKSEVIRFSEKEARFSILFAEPVSPKPELVIAGAGHIGQALCHLANFSGFDVTVLDNRPELANRERLPEAKRILVGKIKDEFCKIHITKNTYIVIVTQGHREDSEALASCVRSNAAYVGMIGSKRKIKLIREKFLAEGTCSNEEFDRVHAPIGIDIGSETVPEIALSIVAQLIQTRRKSEKLPVYCIVLAAGMSTRMKQQKMLLPYEESTIVETVVSKAIASKAGKTLVVLGSNKAELQEKLYETKAELVENRNFADGMLSSVRCGINAISSSAGAAIILLGDQPMVKTEVIDLLIAKYRKSGGKIIVPTFAGKRGHPLLVDLKYRDEINQLDGGIGLRELLNNHPEEIVELEVISDEILKDIDTPDDYQKEIKLLTKYESKNSI